MRSWTNRAKAAGVRCGRGGHLGARPMAGHMMGQPLQAFGVAAHHQQDGTGRIGHKLEDLDSRSISLAAGAPDWPVGNSQFWRPAAERPGDPECEKPGNRAQKPGKLKPTPRVEGLPGSRLRSFSRGHIAMGSIRTWSLAVVAGIFVVVVAHQRSNADGGRRVRSPRWRPRPPRCRHPPTLEPGHRAAGFLRSGGRQRRRRGQYQRGREASEIRQRDGDERR